MRSRLKRDVFWLLARCLRSHTIYDSVDITSELRQAWAEARVQGRGPASVTFAAQCYHHDGGADAKFMLQAHVAYTSQQPLHVIVSDTSWLGFHANKIYNPTGGMGGDVSLSSSDNQPAEHINAAEVLPGWQETSYKPGPNSGWAPVSERTWVSTPQPKETLPISFLPGLKPTELTLLGPGHWFVDFGTEIMAGLTMTVTGGKAGTQLDIKLSEELLCKGCANGRAGHGGPGAGKGCNVCDFNETTKAVLFPMRTNNKYEEVWTLKDGESKFENHEYKLFRWGEIKVVGQPVGLDIEGLDLDLSAWVVRYPWSESPTDLGSFNSSNAMVNQVWDLCLNTVKVTSLDTTTDSNTREKLPYEADGFITGGTRHSMQRDSTWQRHSSLHNIRNPTWPTEWRQIMSLMAYEDYMATGSPVIAQQLYDVILGNTQYDCLNQQTQLIDYTNCSRQTGGVGSKVRDITDWPTDARDGYQMTDIGSVINAYFVACMNAMSKLAGAMGRTADQAKYAAQATATAAAMRQRMFDSSTGLFTDTVTEGQKPPHSAWHSNVFAMWAGARAFPSCMLSILTEIYLCRTYLFLSRNIEDGNARGHRRGAPRALPGPDQVLAAKGRGHGSDGIRLRRLRLFLGALRGRLRSRSLRTRDAHDVRQQLLLPHAPAGRHGHHGGMDAAGERQPLVVSPLVRRPLRPFWRPF
jgi:hypothetical protein